MTEYNPDVWVILEAEDTRKVLGGWYGGFAGSSSWRLSSGITQIIKRDDYYEIHNESGSVYKCHKAFERTSALTEAVFRNWDGCFRKVPIEECL